MIEVGKILPNFTVTYVTGGNSFNFSSLRGQNVVIYFYPKDDTPGCTSEAKSFQLLHSQFVNINTLMFGASRDSMKSHLAFQHKLGLSYELISDTEEELCKIFDVIKTKNFYGKQFQGIERSTFLIDKNGILQHEWRKVRINNHVDDVFQAAQALENHKAINAINPDNVMKKHVVLEEPQNDK